MIGNLGSGTAMLSSESRVEVDDTGDVHSELHIVSDDYEMSQPSTRTSSETPNVSSRLEHKRKCDDSGSEFLQLERAKLKALE
jgi:hypothetical protein